MYHIRVLLHSCGYISTCHLGLVGEMEGPQYSRAWHHGPPSLPHRGHRRVRPLGGAMCSIYLFVMRVMELMP